MDYIIYIYGDMQIFADMFAALSALFNPVAGGVNAFINDGGPDRGVGTAVALAAIFALMTNVVSYMSVEKFEPHKATYGLAVYFVLWMPTVDTVYIADLATSSPSSAWVTIDDVPLGIATIGHALSGISRTINTSLQTDLSSGTIGGFAFNSVALKGHAGLNSTGFLSPLMAILSLREIGFIRDRQIDTNLYFYAKYCIGKARGIPSAAGINWRQLYANHTPLDYLFDTSKIIDTPTKRVDENDKVTIAGCYDLANELNGTASDVGSIRHFIATGPSINSKKFEGLIKDSNQALVSDGALTNTATVNSIFTNELDQVVGTLGFAQELQVQNWIRLRAKMLEHASSLTDTTINSYSMVMSQNIETARMEAAIKGENFLKWSFAAMTGLLFVFYALFPLIGIVMVAKGPKGIEFLGSYILFGLWIYSWQTVSIIINYWSTSNFVYYVNILQTYDDLTLDNVTHYITAAQDAITVGSNLMASVPLITYAVLTGSMFAMTQLSSVATPKGDVSRSVDNQVPQIGTNAPNVDMKSQLSQTAGGINHATHNAAIPALQGFSASQVLTDANNVSKQYSHRESAAKDVSSAIKTLSELVNSKSFGTGTGGVKSIMSSDTSIISSGFSNKVASSLGLSLNENQQAAFNEALAAKFSPNPLEVSKGNSEMNAFLKSVGADHLDSTSVDAAVLNQVATQGSHLLESKSGSTQDERSAISAADSASTAFKEADAYDKIEATQKSHNRQFAQTSGGTGENWFKQMAITMPGHSNSAHDIAQYRASKVIGAANELEINPSHAKALNDRIADIATNYSKQNHKEIGTNRPEAEFAASMKTIGEVMNSLKTNPIEGLSTELAQEAVRNAYNDWFSDVYGQPQGGKIDNKELRDSDTIVQDVEDKFLTFSQKAHDTSASTIHNPLQTPFSDGSLNSQLSAKANSLMSGLTGEQPNYSISSAEEASNALHDVRGAMLDNMTNTAKGIQSELQDPNISRQDKALKQAQLSQLQGEIAKMENIDTTAASAQDGLNKLQMMETIGLNSGAAGVASKVEGTNAETDRAMAEIEPNTEQSGALWAASHGHGGYAFNSSKDIMDIYNQYDTNPDVADARARAALRSGHDAHKPTDMDSKTWQQKENAALDRYEDLKGELGGQRAYMQTMYEFGLADSGGANTAMVAQGAGNAVGSVADMVDKTNTLGSKVRAVGTVTGVAALTGTYVGNEYSGGKVHAVTMMRHELEQQMNGGNKQLVLDMLNTSAEQYKQGGVSNWGFSSGDAQFVAEMPNGSYKIDTQLLNEFYRDKENAGAFSQHLSYLNQLDK